MSFYDVPSRIFKLHLHIQEKMTKGSTTSYNYFHLAVITTLRKACFNKDRRSVAVVEGRGQIVVG